MRVWLYNLPDCAYRKTFGRQSINDWKNFLRTASAVYVKATSVPPVLDRAQGRGPRAWPHVGAGGRSGPTAHAEVECLTAEMVGVGVWSVVLSADEQEKRILVYLIASSGTDCRSTGGDGSGVDGGAGHVHEDVSDDHLQSALAAQYSLQCSPALLRKADIRGHTRTFPDATAASAARSADPFPRRQAGEWLFL